MASITTRVLLTIAIALSVVIKATGRDRVEGTVDELGPIRVGVPSPSGELRTLAGEPMSLASLRGRGALLEFGATWCGPCRAMLRPLRELQEKTSTLPIDIIAVDVNESVDVVKAHYAHRATGGVRVVVDPSGVVAEGYGVQAFPTLVLIDRAGIVRMIHVGAMKDLDPVQREIEKLGVE